ncbi:SAM-dependent methyltransferase TehB [Ursidibacter maritimus]|uniref:SAM-dependent methyltransferase TehB n=1 Tax=Ursidibacter maritimus TaxID=1331689 RepID=A0A949SWK6_9PAST|nr:SAM-dependent methyltransferase TehB [Ursidibacter maritimus]KAE9540509.1 tellurite resistance methyltransferase TehB [Ursidibacter maritimus]MBV6523600.1 SAM-dependent methyltransferase TehB [Ursidibacter maritimus]MBV6525100.1 SAM-dependent methyltransferase TehB [Ursidibacter maritimus]MBV6527302.1 SAM-dependent methyltransferase TehB [Ursidibacter maritimus]MBV6528714.1 SAM-dependent methyltransferase TehB [Ursidibacter maritimus]
MQELICYKQMPVWTKESLPQMFQEKHNTKVGTWAKLTILKGAIKYYELTEQGAIVSEEVFDVNHQRPFVEPQVWHKVEALTDDLECQLAFYCKPEDYFAKKYNLTTTHSEVLNAINYIQQGKALDLGCGRGRNALYLNLLGFNVTAVDHNQESIDFLNYMIEKEGATQIQTGVYDINQADIQGEYDLIISTVVMMFLNRERIPVIIENMQRNTKIGGYNLIVCAMDTENHPCSMPFSFTFKEGELKNYYQGWELVKYNEDLGHLHKTDANGNRIQLQFATMLAKKISDN